jgi:hypothetical protein
VRLHCKGLECWRAGKKRVIRKDQNAEGAGSLPPLQISHGSGSAFEADRLREEVIAELTVFNRYHADRG